MGGATVGGDGGRGASLCTLWDLTVSASVSAYLSKLGAAEVIVCVLEKSTPSDREAELCFGVLANLCTSEEAAGALVEGDVLCTAVREWLLSSVNAQTLCEAVRLLRCAVYYCPASRLSQLAVEEDVMKSIVRAWVLTLNPALCTASATLIMTALERGSDRHKKASQRGC